MTPPSPLRSRGRPSRWSIIFLITHARLSVLCWLLSRNVVTHMIAAVHPHRRRIDSATTVTIFFKRHLRQPDFVTPAAASHPNICLNIAARRSMSPASIRD